MGFLLNIKDFERYIENHKITNFSILLPNEKGRELAVIPINDYYFSSNNYSNYIEFECHKRELPYVLLNELYSSDIHLIVAEIANKESIIIMCLFVNFINKTNNCKLKFNMIDIYQKKHMGIRSQDHLYK